MILCCIAAGLVEPVHTLSACAARIAGSGTSAAGEWMRDVVVIVPPKIGAPNLLWAFAAAGVALAVIALAVLIPRRKAQA